MADGSGAGGASTGGSSLPNGGNGIEMEGGPCMLSVSTAQSVGGQGSAQTPTQLVRNPFHGLKHLAWQFMEVRRHLSLNPLLQLVQHCTQIDRHVESGSGRLSPLF